jgi:hypothetical protein
MNNENVKVPGNFIDFIPLEDHTENGLSYLSPLPYINLAFTVAYRDQGFGNSVKYIVPGRGRKIGLFFTLNPDPFLGALANLSKATVSFVMSVCSSVCPHGKTRVLLDRFL